MTTQYPNAETVYDQGEENPFPTDVTDEYLSGEIVFLWAGRQHSRYLMNHHKREMLNSDIVLAELLLRQKLKLSRLGRNGGWNAWLKQNKIVRATADRLALQHAEAVGLRGELPHRVYPEPLQGNICQAAHRTSDRFEDMLRSPISRVTFMGVLGDLFGLHAEWEAEGVRLTIPPIDEREWMDERVPNVMAIRDGKVCPVDYELKDFEPEDERPD